MKLKTGDRVKFLNDVGEGMVTAIIDKKTVMVSTEDGFDIPVLEDDLLLVQRESKKEEAPVREEVKEEMKADREKEEDIPVTDEEIVFALRIKNNSEIHPWLINLSTYHLYYTIARKQEGEHLLLQAGRLEPETQVSILKILPSALDEAVIIYVNLVFFGESFYKPVSPVNRKIEFLPSGLYSGLLLQENDYFENKAAIFPVYRFREITEEFSNTRVEGDLKKVLQEKQDMKPLPQKKEKPEKPEPEEVDLHIQHIVDDYSGLSNGEIIEIQMARFRTSLETAIIHKTRRIVFIHGIGNGKLKYEIRKKLDQDYPQLKYQDASFREYGYGATMVLIKG